MAEDYIFEPLNDTHDRSGFSCGVAALDTYLRQQAGQDRRRRLAAVFVMREPEQTAIVGYYTLSAYAVNLSDLAATTVKRLGRYPQVLCMLLGRLAVDRRYQGHGLGGVLLVNALQRCYHNEIAAALVVVDALDEAAATFYERFGFTRLPQHALRLVLPLSSVTDLVTR
jgi:predicted N-acetyltransferase YhbS